MNYKNFFKDKSLLITGGTGSFGRKFAKKILLEYDPRRVIIFSRDEWKQWVMRQEDPIFDDPRIRFFLGDVRDLQRLTRAFNDVDYIIHAAALKQVPAAEYNPSEFLKTNVIGGMNVIEAAITAGVQKVIALSSDKACNPINLYGASKLCADKLFINGNVYVGKKGSPIFSVVRYGNVIGSRGSIIPLWQNQALIAKRLTITDPRMTRFWITLDQAVDFVIFALVDARGGELYVPKIPSMKIVDLAEAIAPKVEHIFTGAREGEKLHEIMICVEDAPHTVDQKNHYIIIPETHSRNPAFLDPFLMDRSKETLPEGFAYTSENNKEWLSIEKLRKLISEEKI